MLLSDVIKVIGNTPLKEYPWGLVVVDTINLFVDGDHRLTDESDGQDVYLALDSLSDDVKGIVLLANLDTHRCCITAPVGGNMVVEYEEEEEEGKKELDFFEVSRSPIVMAASMVVFAVVIMALVMTGTLSSAGDITAVLAEILSILWPVVL